MARSSADQAHYDNPLYDKPIRRINCLKSQVYLADVEQIKRTVSVADDDDPVINAHNDAGVLAPSVY